MRCDAVQEAVSAAMDRGPALSEPQLDHVRTCPSCSRFHDQAWRLRELARFEVAPPVPDLVPAIMQRVRKEGGASSSPGRRLLARPPRLARLHLDRGGFPAGTRRRTHRVPLPAIAAALVVGLVVGFVLASGGIVSPPPENVAALAAEIPDRLQQAAVELKGYTATFDVTELHWSRRVPRRAFVADLSFRAPESFRVEVRDTTSYPCDDWPRNDLTLVTDGRTYRATGPNPCPAAALPACPQPLARERAVIHRAPFDPSSSAPTDIIVPMTVLAATDRVNVRAAGGVAGRDAVVVELSYQDAGSLFEYLRFLGSWRAFYPEDRVLVWLDRATWFPLRYEVHPAPGSERELWAAQRGLPREDPGRPVFTANARTFSMRTPPAAAFTSPPPDAPADEGFIDRPLSELHDVTAMTPTQTLGLRPWRFGSYPRSKSRPFEEWVAAYARGLTWLTVTRVEAWDQPLLFGVGSFAEPVDLPGGGLGHYEPASESEPRRVALHTAEGEFLVSTNLPRAALLQVAGSLSAEGRAVPRNWLTHRWAGGVVEEGLDVEAAVRRAGFIVLLPGRFNGYQPVSGQAFRGTGRNGVAVAFRRPAAELDGVGLLLYEALGQPMPPPTRGDVQAVEVRGVMGRWSPGQHELEWIEGGVYVSLSGPSFGLSALLEVADSMVADGSGM